METNMSDILSSLAYLNGKPTAQGKLKLKPEHFQVNENLGLILPVKANT
ncbi:tRNA pseudouridine 13 synthase [Vibrio ponticus]|nr:tRNA pseudouridine 13 synthase [Vibrio ponticus]